MNTCTPSRIKWLLHLTGSYFWSQPDISYCSIGELVTLLLYSFGLSWFQSNHKSSTKKMYTKCSMIDLQPIQNTSNQLYCFIKPEVDFYNKSVISCFGWTFNRWRIFKVHWKNRINRLVHLNFFFGQR